jgi:hypothetical protein
MLLSLEASILLILTKMKTSILSFCLVLAVNSIIFGQSLVIENRTWSNTWIGTEHGDHFHSYYIKFEGDVIINNRSYKKIYKSEDESQLTWKLHGYIREDSSKKVYIYDEYYQQDQLLYDFGLQIGDSLLPPNHPFYMYVCDIKYINFENSTDSFKQIDISYGPNCDWPEITWIEGLGSTGGILNGLPEVGLCCIEQCLVCYFESDTLIYHNEGFNTCFPQGFPEGIDQYDERLQPIKVLYDKNQIIFDFGDLITVKSKLKIFNLNGNLKTMISLDGEKNFILPQKYFIPGFYVYTFQNKAENLSGRLIITQE